MEDKNGGRMDGAADTTESKKRSALKQMRKEEVHDDNDEEDPIDLSGNFQRASQEVMSQRRIVKVSKRGAAAVVEEPKLPPPGAPAFSFNFASTKQKEEKVENEKKIEKTKENEVVTEVPTEVGKFVLVEKQEEESPFNFKIDKPATSSFMSFTNPTGSTPPSIPPFSFSSSFAMPSIGSSTAVASNSSPIFGLNIVPPKTALVSPNASESKIEEKPDLPSEPVKTGEEDESHVFQVRAKLFVLSTDEHKWVERGVGNLRLNVANNKSYARLVMRMEASLKLILNVALWPAMKVEKADKGVRFTATSLSGTQLDSYFIKFGMQGKAEELIDAINQNKHVGKSETKSEKSNKTTPSTSPTKKE